MADDPEVSNGSRAPRDNWELVFSILHEPDDVLAEARSSSLSPKKQEHEQDTTEPPFDTSEFINMDYFASPSKDDSTQNPIQQHSGAMLGAATEENNGSPTAATPELDWIEPSVPFRSCVLVTSEDDDSSSKSCSGDSREGTEHLSRDKDAGLSTGFEREPFGGDIAAAVLHDVPMEVIEESHTEAAGMVNDASSGGDNEGAPWRRRFGAWLSAAGRASTLCSIALAATVIGLVLAGSGWQRLRIQYQKLRCRFFSKGKGISQVMYQLVQIKESSSSIRRIPVSKTQSSFPSVLNHV